jgi:hypothetical protein
LLVAVTLLAACGNGDDDSTDGTGSDAGTGHDGSTGTGIATGAGSLFCNDVADLYCVSFASVPAGAEAQDCTFVSGVQVDACPSANVVATCTFNAGGTDQEYFWYEGNVGTTTELHDECDSLSGTFTSF